MAITPINLTLRNVKGSAITATENDANLTDLKGGVEELDTNKAEADSVYTKTEVLSSFGNLSSPLLDLPLQNSLAMNKGVGSVTFSRSTTATYIDRYGVLQAASIDEPRFEADGLLIEGASTNYTLDSNDFSTANWTSQGVVPVSSSTLCSDGISNSTRLTCSALNENHRIIPAVADACPVGNEAFSIDVKGGTHNLIGIAGYSIDLTEWVVIDTSDGSHTDFLGSSKVIALTDGWYRVSFSGTTTTNNMDWRIGFNDPTKPTAYDLNWLSTGTETAYFAFAQHEALPFATSYIPTTTTAVTRSADICSVTFDGNMLNHADAYSIVADYNIPSYNVATTYSRGMFGVVNEQYRYLRIATSGANMQGLFGYTTTKEKSTFGFVFSDTQSFLYDDGELKVTGGKATVTVVGERSIVIGNQGHSAANTQLHGHIKNFKIYDKALTATEIALA